MDPEVFNFVGVLHDFGADGGEVLGGAEAVERAFGGALGDFLMEETDAFHEEFVGVAGVDGEEFDAFEEGRAGVEGFVEDAVVEVEPGEVAVEEAGIADGGFVDAGEGGGFFGRGHGRNPCGVTRGCGEGVERTGTLVT